MNVDLTAREARILLDLLKLGWRAGMPKTEQGGDELKALRLKIEPAASSQPEEK